MAILSSAGEPGSDNMRSVHDTLQSVTSYVERSLHGVLRWVFAGRKFSQLQKQQSQLLIFQRIVVLGTLAVDVNCWGDWIAAPAWSTPV